MGSEEAVLGSIFTKGTADVGGPVGVQGIGGDRPAVIILDPKSARALHPGQDIESLFRCKGRELGRRPKFPVLF